MLYLALSLTAVLAADKRADIVCHKDFEKLSQWQCDHESADVCQFDRIEGKCKAKCTKFNGMEDKAAKEKACEKQDACFYNKKENMCLQPCDNFHGYATACEYQNHCKYDLTTDQCTLDEKKKKKLRTKSDPCMDKKYEKKATCTKPRQKNRVQMVSAPE